MDGYSNEFPFNEDIFYQPRKRKDGIKNKSKDFKELLTPFGIDEEEEVKIVRARGAWNIVKHSILR